LVFVFEKDVRQLAAFLHFDVMIMEAQELNQLPNLRNVLVCARLEPKCGSSGVKALWWVRQILIEPN
jgi:hypothetical protein